MGLTVTSGVDVNGQKTPVTVFRRDAKGYTFYSLGVASKGRDGSWANGYVDCAFKKGVELGNKAKIVINNAFYNVSKSGDKTYVKIFINDFSVVDSGEGMPTQDTASNNDFLNIPEGLEDELPFN